MKVSKNFDIREFVPQSLWMEKGRSCLWYVNPTIIQLAQFYKDFFSEYFGEEVLVKINDWHYGGVFNERGWRAPYSETGSIMSFHKGGLCSAFDCEIVLKASGKEIDPAEIHKIILDNQKLFMQKGLTTLENKTFAPGWTHSDCRNTGLPHILVVGERR